MIPPISLSMIPFVLALTATINAVPTERQVISATETGQSYNATSAKGCSRGHRHHHHHHHHHPNYNGTSTIASESVTVAVVGVSSSTSAPASATDLLIEPSSVVSAVDGSASDSAVDVISTDSSLYEPSTTEIAFATDPASGVTTDAATTESSAMISASSTVDVVTPTSSSSSTAASPTGDGGDDTSAWPEADEWLKSHNDIRAHYAAAPVTWNNSLAEYSSNYGQHCNWSHSRGPYGENLAAGVGALTPNDTVTIWGNEAKNYDYSKPGFGLNTGHFTQVVWKATTQIGCSITSCDQLIGQPGKNWLYAICEYSPRGNVLWGVDDPRFFVENVGPYQA